MSESIEQLKNKLKATGYSLTSPRKIVFLALQNKEPLSMNQLILNCPGVDRASIYRSISLYEKLGIVQRLNIGWKYKIELSNDFQNHHHHLSCIKCLRVIPFEESSSLEKQLKQISDKNNFTMQDHQLEIQGICNSCLKS